MEFNLKRHINLRLLKLKQVSFFLTDILVRVSILRLWSFSSGVAQHKTEMMNKDGSSKVLTSK